MKFTWLRLMTKHQPHRNDLFPLRLQVQCSLGCRRLYVFVLQEIPVLLLAQNHQSSLKAYDLERYSLAWDPYGSPNSYASTSAPGSIKSHNISLLSLLAAFFASEAVSWFGFDIIPGECTRNQSLRTHARNLRYSCDEEPCEF